MRPWMSASGMPGVTAVTRLHHSRRPLLCVPVTNAPVDRITCPIDIDILLPKTGRVCVAKIQWCKLLVGLNVSCHYTHGVAHTSLVSQVRGPLSGSGSTVPPSKSDNPVTCHMAGQRLNHLEMPALPISHRPSDRLLFSGDPRERCWGGRSHRNARGRFRNVGPAVHARCPRARRRAPMRGRIVAPRDTTFQATRTAHFSLLQEAVGVGDAQDS
jgi:hypothetical protein